MKLKIHSTTGTFEIIDRDYCVLTVYDESRPAPKREPPDYYSILSPEMLAAAIERADEMIRLMEGESHGFLHTASLTIHQHKATEFAFDGEIQYSEAEVLEIIRLAKQAKDEMQWLFTPEA